MNLADDPFIPVINCDDTRAEVGMREALVRAHEIKAICSPSARFGHAMTSYLAAAASCAHGGIKDQRARESLVLRGKFDHRAIEAYMPSGDERFELFGQRPFLQMMEENLPSLDGLGEGSVKNIQTLLDEWPSGNNKNMRQSEDPSKSRPITPALAARAFISFQALGLGGGPAGHDALPGRLKSRSPAIRSKATNFLIHGRTLMETICFNLLTEANFRALGLRLGTDAPSWDLPLTRPENNNVFVIRGPLHLMTFPAHYARLLPNESGMVEKIVFVSSFLTRQRFPELPWFARRIVTRNGRPPEVRNVVYRHDNWLDRHSLLAHGRTQAFHPPPLLQEAPRDRITRVESLTIDASSTKGQFALAESVSSFQWFEPEKDVHELIRLMANHADKLGSYVGSAGGTADSNARNNFIDHARIAFEDAYSLLATGGSIIEAKRVWKDFLKYSATLAFESSLSGVMLGRDRSSQDSGKCKDCAQKYLAFRGRLKQSERELGMEV